MSNSSQDASAALAALTEKVLEYYQDREAPLILGIANGGIALAKILAEKLKSEEPIGILNPLFHRDDLSANPIPKDFEPTQIPFDIENREVLLVDDVFASGRTLRATLNELFDHGRPQVVRFATLYSTQSHKLPYCPDFIGQDMELSDNIILKVNLDETKPSSCHFEIVNP